MFQHHLITYADLGVGIRASGRLSQDVFRAPLDRIEEALPEDLRKAGINQWLGNLMCAQYRNKVFTVQHPDAEVPFAGARFTRAAPGGYDILCRQRVATLASYPLPPGCPEGSWRSVRFGAFSSNWLDLFGERAKRFGGLGERQGAGP